MRKRHDLPSEVADPCVTQHRDAPACGLLCQGSPSFRVSGEHHCFRLDIKVPEFREEALCGLHELLCERSLGHG